MEELTIRPATPADSPHFTELAFVAKGSRDYPAEWLELWRDELTVTPAYLEAHTGFVAERGGRPVGCCVLEASGEGWTLEHMWVDPAAQGGGIGRALVSEVLREAWRRRRAPVELVADPFAEAFYARLGARRVGELAAPMPGAPERALPVMLFEPSEAATPAD